ncbi:hypothetical protein [Pedobacter sp. NJ-S-72]
MQEAKRRMYFRNRMYITEKLISWLKQRKHANPSLEVEINQIIYWMTGMENRGLTYICDFIKNKRSNFEKVAPVASSKCFKYYTEAIIPILDFCTNWDKNSD